MSEPSPARASQESPTPRSSLLIGTPLNGRRNSLNLIRLILATSVIFHHSFPLHGDGLGPVFLGDRLGGWAVIGFFGLSGYLITASRLGKSFGTYLTLRIARIYPAFLVCLLTTPLIFAPLNFWHANGSLSGFGSTPTTPFAYVFVNSGLKMLAYDVAGTPVGVPYPGAWNGSLWSLYYEFFCYILVGLLGIFAIVRKSPWPMIVAWAASVMLRIVYEPLHAVFGVGFDLDMLTKLVPYFFAGGVLYVLRRHIGMHAGLAAFSAVAFVALLFMSPSWGGQVGSVFATYVLLWFGHVLPSPEVVRVHDISYGMYIYGFQMQQIIMTFIPSIGYWALSFGAIALSVAFAVPSWLFVERPIIEAARRSVQRAAG